MSSTNNKPKISGTKKKEANNSGYGCSCLTFITSSILVAVVAAILPLVFLPFHKEGHRTDAIPSWYFYTTRTIISNVCDKIKSLVEPSEWRHIEIVNSYQITQVQYIFVYYKFPELFKESNSPSLSAREIQKILKEKYNTELDLDALSRFLDLATTFEFVYSRYPTPGYPPVFKLSDFGSMLARGHSSGLVDLVLAGPVHWDIWQNDFKSVLSNGIPKEESPKLKHESIIEADKTYDQWIGANLLADYAPFKKTEHLCEVGINSGGQLLVQALLNYAQNTTATYIGPESERSIVDNLIKLNPSINGRLQFVAASPNNFKVNGCESIVLNRVLERYSDADAVEIIKNAEMYTNEVIIVEELVDPRGTHWSSFPYFERTRDFELMLSGPGKHRTKEDIYKLVSSSGLKAKKTIPTRTPLNIIVAVPDVK